jgi:hypothetical protein
MSRTLLIILLLPLTLTAQRKLNLTVFGGFSNYSGDLQDKRFTLDQAHKAFGAGLSLELAPKWNLHGTLRKGKVSADDKFSSDPLKRARNLNFVSNIYEAALTVEYSFNDLYYKRWTPYVFLGGAFFRFNPYGSGNGGAELRPLSTEGQGFVDGRRRYRIITLAVPAGAGIRLRVSDNVCLGYELGFRATLTDYLDDVSKTYVDHDLLLQNRGQRSVDFAFRGDEIKPDALYPSAGTVRGSPKYKDFYYFSGLTLFIGITNEDGRLFGRNPHRGSVACPKSVL